jgi:hypothetical protein
LKIFRVEIRQHPPESEFAISSVGVPSSTLDSGVARRAMVSRLRGSVATPGDAAVEAIGKVRRQELKALFF